MIIWAGTSNLDVGMVIEHYPSVIFPERSQEVQHVPGRNGDVILPYGAFQNYEQPYQAFLDAKKYGGLEQIMPRVADWLLGHTGYHRLEDSYFPDVYRMAYYSGGAEFVSIFNEYGEGTLTFNCAPEKYYKSGEREIILENNQLIRNPTAFEAMPLIVLTGNGNNGTLHFNDKTIDIKPVPENITIDVKLHKAYDGTTSYNNRFEGLFENLKLGKETEISWEGGITGMKLTPRWWTI